MSTEARALPLNPPVGAAQDEVYLWLKRHVLSLPSGEGTFLTEAEVCRQTGTSRTPVREALLRLEADGLLQIVPKKGAFVPAITEADVEAIMQARDLVEQWCVRQAASLGAMLADELDRLIDEQMRVRNNPVAFIESDREFHRTIIRAAGNPILAEFYESLRDRQLRMGMHAIANSQSRIESVLREHAAIGEAVRNAAPDVAASAVAEHLAKTLVVLRLRPA